MKARFLSTAALLGAGMLLAACSNGQGDTSPKVSAQVITQPATRGSLPNLVTAYGTAMPGVDAATTLSIRAEGQVTHFDVTDGAAVKAGQPLLSFDLAPSAVASYAQAVAALKLARTQREQTKKLLAQQLATRDQLAQAERAVSDAQTALAALAEQQGNGKTVTLRAPYAGVVTSISATRGQTLSPGAPLLALSRAGGLVIMAGVEPDPQQPVKPGAKAHLQPLGAGRSITGTVLRVASALNPQTHLIDTQIAPDQPVTPGMGFQASIAVGKVDGWLVPRDALQGKDGQWSLFQVSNGKAAKVEVKVLAEDGPNSIVSGKLDPRQPVVTTGGTQLDDGMAVRASKLGAGK